MDTAELAVLAGSAVAMAGTALFFFGPRKAADAARTGGVQEIDLAVDGGYRPDRIVAEAGVPLRLQVLRTDKSACTEQIAFRDLGILRDLPTGKVITLDLPALQPGAYEFTCGMNMVRGQLLVR
jgi:plastocyanin domain-containing protein